MRSAVVVVATLILAACDTGRRPAAQPKSTAGSDDQHDGNDSADYPGR